MAITYNNPEIANNAVSVVVTFTNDLGYVFSRSINVPYVNGVFDQAAWTQRLEDHLRAVIHKSDIGVITFVDPAAVGDPVPPPTVETANT